MTKLTKAQDAVFAFTSGLEVQAFEFCYNNAVTVREAFDCDVIRFSDDSEVKVYMSEDHEITILEA